MVVTRKERGKRRMNFNDKLQSLRKKNGITQEDLAEKLEVTRQTISKWECGESTPDFHNLVKISEMFGVSTDFLLKEEVPAEDHASRPANETKTVVIKRKFDHTSLLGACMFGAGVISILVFFILSMVYPMTVMNEYGTFDGLMGFLIYQKIVWVFAVACIVTVAGLLLLLMPIFKEKRKSGKSSAGGNGKPL